MRAGTWSTVMIQAAPIGFAPAVAHSPMFPSRRRTGSRVRQAKHCPHGGDRADDHPLAISSKKECARDALE
jgi:hypothetical protein